MNNLTFDISNEDMVISSTYVMNQKMPILYVAHDFDEEEGVLWQFHCGNGDYEMSKMLLVSLDNIFQLDPSIRKIHDLPINFEARRASTGARWIYSAVVD